MPEVILVVLGRPDRADGLLAVAGHAAGLLGGALINVLAVRDPVQVSGLAAEMVSDEVDALVASKAAERQRVRALRTSFDHWSRQDGIASVAARWSDVEGSAATVVEQRGSRSDLIVIGRPEHDGRSLRQSLRAALFQTDRPVLVVPPGAPASFGRRVAIAWRDDGCAVKAVVPALRYLSGAEQLLVLAGRREPEARPLLPQVLLERGAPAELHVLPIGPGPFGSALLAKAHDLRADMIVMGAYAHSPLRELILGGVTRYMLTHSDLPLLTRH